MKGDYYKNKYVIVVSEETELEYVVAVFDNLFEMAKQLDRTLSSLRSVITKIYQGERNYVMYQGKRHNVSFIPVSVINEVS
jgi:hypothetical protein